MFYKHTGITLAISIFFFTLTNFTNAQSWTQLSPNPDPTYGFPTTRSGHTAVYDTTNNLMTIFGGSSYGSILDDVWALSTANGLEGTPAWIQLFPSGSSPSGRVYHSAIYDNVNNIMTIFGGFTTGIYLNDVWILGTANGLGGTPTWTQLFPTGSAPTTRELHTAVYDPTSNRMIVFGGYNNVKGALNDLWVLSHANGLGGAPAWTNYSPAGTPPSARYAHTAIYDTTSNQMIIYGGYSGSTYLNDVWVLSYANGLGGTPTWTKLSPTGETPANRAYHTAIYDNSNNSMTIFGGYNGSYLNDVWVLNNANGSGGTPLWLQISPTVSDPTTRYGHTAVYDPVNNLMTIFGGLNGSEYFNDVWVLSTANGEGVWNNYVGDFDQAIDTTYWAYQTPPNVTIQPPVTWLSTYQNHTGILKLSYNSSTEGLKLTSFPRFSPNPNQPWYRIRVTYYCNPTCTNESITPVILLYQDDTSQTIQELGASYTGNSLIQSGYWYTLDAYIYCHTSSGQLQLLMKNGGSNGAMYIDSIELDNIAPPAVSYPVLASVTGAPMNSASDTTYWGFALAPNETSQPQISWLSSYLGQDSVLQDNVLELNFMSNSQGTKMTSLLGIIPTDSNAILSFNVYVTNPTDIEIEGFLYGEKSLTPFECDIAGYVNTGIIPANTWTTLFVPLSSVSQQSTFRLQLLIKNNNQFPEQVYVNDIQLFYSSVPGYDSLLVKENDAKHSAIELALRN
jgi:hypothetical protein